MIKRIYLLLCLMTAVAVFADDIKVMKTNPVDVNVTNNGEPCVQVNVDLQVANVKNEEYSVAIIMDNLEWPSNLTYEQFFNLVETRCFNEAFVPATDARTNRTVRINVPIEKKKLSAKNDSLFLKAYVFKLDPFEYVTSGALMYIVPNYQVLRDKMMGSGLGIAGDFLGEFLFGRSPGNMIPDNAEYCGRCLGDGKCTLCLGTGVYQKKKCTTCEGSGICPRCDGKGYIYNIFNIFK